jgi:ribonuclease R
VAREQQNWVALLKEAGRPLGVKELLRLAGVHPGQQTAVKRELRELVAQGQLVKTGKRFVSADKKPIAPSARVAGSAPGKPPPSRMEGILRVHRDGFGFVEPITGDGEDIYLPRGETQRALDNDRVLIQIDSGRTSGRLVKVLERRRQQVVGTYVEEGRGAHVVPKDANLPGPISVPKTQLARNGDLVKVVLTEGHDGAGRLAGEVSGSLGKTGEVSAEVLSIAYSHGFSDEFAAPVMEEAARVANVDWEGALASGRRDLRSLPLVTIDGEDARDFDDAVFAAPHRNGWRLVVAIADVAEYVVEGGALDVEAVRRGTSVYLPDRVLPMLPERLSNGVCSLRPNEDRLCLVAEMIFDRGARMRSFELYPGVMRSAARCTYNEVESLLLGEDLPHLNWLKEHVQSLDQLSRALTQMREERGAIDFDLPETKVVLDEAGKPLRMERRERKQSHRLIEECMLAANEAVAKFFQNNRLPTIYRYHGEPDVEKLATFAELANAHGFRLGNKGEISSKDLNLFLEKLEGHAESRVLNQLLLRSMMQAVYSAKAVGHYGLGATHYLHFTSPIRRYPDLIVHRLLRQYWLGQRQPSARLNLEAETEKLEGIALQSSERERAAMRVEREVTSLYSTLLMRDRVGEEFAGTVSALTDFGCFVELDGLWVEGLVKAQTLGTEFKFDKKLQMAVVGSSGLKIRVGQKIRVRLVSANLQRRQLDFEMLGAPAAAQIGKRKETVRDKKPERVSPGRDSHRRGRRPRARPGRQ